MNTFHNYFRFFWPVIRPYWFRGHRVDRLTVGAELLIENWEYIIRSFSFDHIQLRDAGNVLHILSDHPVLAVSDFFGLSFSPYSLTDGELEQLATLPSLLRRVTDISIIECSIEGMGLIPVLESMQSASIESLSFVDLPLTDSSAVSMFERLPTSLAHLSLSKISLSPDSVKALVSTPVFSLLSDLTLSNCCLLADSMRILCSQREASALVSLNVSDNSISDDGIRALSDSRSFPQLEKLSLDNCSISDAGIDDLLRSSVFRTLADLSIRNNVFSCEVIDRLRYFASERRFVHT